jgi:hypothetical protein
MSQACNFVKMGGYKKIYTNNLTAVAVIPLRQCCPAATLLHQRRCRNAIAIGAFVCSPTWFGLAVSIESL